VAGGAAGNLADRLLRSPGSGRGAVVDWIHVAGYPATFNLADVAIRAGAAGALVATLAAGRRAARRTATPGSASLAAERRDAADRPRVLTIRSRAREAIAPHRRLCADQITTAGGPRRVPFGVHQASTGKGSRRTGGYSRGDAVAEPALRSSARGSLAVSACIAVISAYDTGCPPSIT
jgi:hypothetical protein